MGDSYAEALQVPQENAFWSVMESLLQTCDSLGTTKDTVGAPLRGRPLSLRPEVVERRGAYGVAPIQYSRKIEVINFGVSGYSTAQQLITLRERVWAYSPDVVL